MTTKTHMSQFEDFPLEDLPRTNPPAEYSDLGYRPQGEILFNCPDLALETPELMTLWSALVEEARKNPLVKVEGSSIRRVMDGAEIDRQIDNAVEEYNLAREAFHSIVNGSYTGAIYSFTISKYTDREAIKWDKKWADEKNRENAGA